MDNNIFLAIKASVAAVCGAFGAAFGWVGWLVAAWVGCMVADYLSGSAAAMAKGDWRSDAARAGIWHKAGMIAVVLVAAVTDSVLGLTVHRLPISGLDYECLVLPMVLVWYIFTELGSIAENATDMGAPVPAWLTKLLAAGKKTAEEASHSAKT